jgi:hypothetical protein
MCDQRVRLAISQSPRPAVPHPSTCPVSKQSTHPHHHRHHVISLSFLPPSAPLFISLSSFLHLLTPYTTLAHTRTHHIYIYTHTPSSSVPPCTSLSSSISVHQTKIKLKKNSISAIICKQDQ